MRNKRIIVYSFLIILLLISLDKVRSDDIEIEPTLKSLWSWVQNDKFLSIDRKANIMRTYLFEIKKDRIAEQWVSLLEEENRLFSLSDDKEKKLNFHLFLKNWDYFTRTARPESLFLAVEEEDLNFKLCFREKFINKRLGDGPKVETAHLKKDKGKADTFKKKPLSRFSDSDRKQLVQVIHNSLLKDVLRGDRISANGKIGYWLARELIICPRRDLEKLIRVYLKMLSLAEENGNLMLARRIFETVENFKIENDQALSSRRNLEVFNKQKLKYGQRAGNLENYLQIISNRQKQNLDFIPDFLFEARIRDKIETFVNLWDAENSSLENLINSLDQLSQINLVDEIFNESIRESSSLSFPKWIPLSELEEYFFSEMNSSQLIEKNIKNTYFEMRDSETNFFYDYLSKTKRIEKYRDEIETLPLRSWQYQHMVEALDKFNIPISEMFKLAEKNILIGEQFSQIIIRTNQEIYSLFSNGIDQEKIDKWVWFLKKMNVEDRERIVPPLRRMSRLAVEEDQIESPLTSDRSSQKSNRFSILRRLKSFAPKSTNSARSRQGSKDSVYEENEPFTKSKDKDDFREWSEAEVTYFFQELNISISASMKIQGKDLWALYSDNDDYKRIKYKSWGIEKREDQKKIDDKLESLIRRQTLFI